MVSWKRSVTFRGVVESTHSKNELDKKEATPERTITVRFDDSRNTEHHHYSLDELSDEEYHSMWVTPEDHMACKRDYVAIVRIMMRGGMPESDDFCSRGLEFKTKQGSRRRKQIKMRACHAVLDEQAIQRDEGVEDADFLSDLYREMSSPSCLEALNRGLKDQRVMLDMVKEEGGMEHLTNSVPKEVPSRSSKGLNKGLEVPVRKNSITSSLNEPDLARLQVPLQV